MTQLELCKVVATIAHAGQFRRDGITPYITHPEAVANSLENEELKCVAWLHDVLEDTKVTFRNLIDIGIHPSIVVSANFLSKNDIKNEAYLDSYLKYIVAIKVARPDLIPVKLADIAHNMSSNPTRKQTEKYTKALEILNS